MPAYVYLLTCEVTGKRYVGISTVTPTDRFKRHCTEAAKGSPLYLHRAIRKYGAAAFTLTQVAEGATWQEVQVLERRYITDYGTFAPAGYNMTAGGEGTLGYRHQDDAKAVMSQKHAGKVISAETRQRMSESKMGGNKSPEIRANMAVAQRRWQEENPERAVARTDKMMTARRLVDGPLSEDHKAKLSAATKGQKVSPEIVAARTPLIRAAMTVASVRAKIVANNTGRPVSEATRAKMRESCREAALANPEFRAKVSAANAARDWSDEARAKIGAAHRGKPKPPEVREKMRLAGIAAHARRKAAAAAAREGSSHV